MLPACARARRGVITTRRPNAVLSATSSSASSARARPHTSSGKSLTRSVLLPASPPRVVAGLARLTAPPRPRAYPQCQRANRTRDILVNTEKKLSWYYLKQCQHSFTTLEVARQQDQMTTDALVLTTCLVEIGGFGGFMVVAFPRGLPRPALSAGLAACATPLSGSRMTCLAPTLGRLRH